MPLPHILRCLRAASFGLLALAMPAAAVEPELITPGKLTYGLAATFAPFEYFVDGKMVGFDVEFTEALAAKLGLQANPLNMEFRGLIPALQGKRVDIVNSAMYITAARLEQVDFVPYLLIGTQMVVKKGNPAKVSGRDDLCGKRVAVTLGGIQETYARQDSERCVAAGKPAPTVMTFPGAQDAALSVRNARADAYYESTAGVARITSEMADVFEAVGPIFETGTRVGMAVRKGDTEMAARLDGAIRALAADGTYQKLIAKYNLPRESSLF
jgi:polar amino acid transport system substrate-binding protein